jgi:hypothetical protein
MRLWDKLGYLVKSTMRRRSVSGTSSAPAQGDLRELEGIRATIQASEARRQRIEERLANSTADVSTEEHSQLKAQLAELQRSENKLRTAAAVIETAASLAAGEGQSSQSQSPVSPGDNVSTERSGPEETGNSIEDTGDLASRKRRLSG